MILVPDEQLGGGVGGISHGLWKFSIETVGVVEPQQTFLVI